MQLGEHSYGNKMSIYNAPVSAYSLYKDLCLACSNYIAQRDDGIECAFHLSTHYTMNINGIFIDLTSKCRVPFLEEFSQQLRVVFIK